MSRVLILFAHPNLQRSRIHSRLLDGLPDLPGVTLHDLYEAYPLLDIDIDREQELAESHDVLIFQHPLFWYSTPPMLKQWQDLVLEHGWAYGSAGNALRGKTLLNVISAGGTENAYQAGGYNRFTVRQLLAPVEQTAYLCGIRFLPPFVIFGTHRLDPPDIDRAAESYVDLIRGLHDDAFDLGSWKDADTLNRIVHSAGDPAAREGS